VCAGFGGPAGRTHQRRVGGVPPALGPHQVQGVQGGILVLGQPARAAPHALAHHCAGGEGRGESAACPPPGNGWACGCRAAVLTAVPHASPRAHGVGLVLCPRGVLAAVLREVHSGEGGLPSALLGGRRAAERGSGAVGRSHLRLPKTASERASLAGHQCSWAPAAGLGTGKDSARVPARKAGWCFCRGAGRTLTQFHPRAPRRHAPIQIRAAGRNLLELAAGRAGAVPGGNSPVRAPRSPFAARSQLLGFTLKKGTKPAAF